MYESKYRRFVTNNTNRFANEEEIVETLLPDGEGAGVPMYAKDGIVYVDDRDNHTITVGGTGCGKTRLICKNTIMSLITKAESMIVNDPKGELYRATAAYAKKMGYKINVLNLRSPEKSDHWNPLFQIFWYYINGQVSKAQQAIDDFVKSLMSKIESEKDRYWENVAGNFFGAVLEICMMCSGNAENFTLENILPLCKEAAEKTLKAMIEKIDDLPESMKTAFDAVLGLSAEKTKSCIYGVLNGGIGSFAKNESLLRLFSSNDINFYKLAEEPTVIYVIYPDEKQAMNNIVTAFFTQAYTSLLDVCEARADDKLPIRVNFILDEFSNLCPLESFDNRISQARSKNIRYHLFIQSMNQLSEKYGDKVADTILSNCTSWICFSSKEIKFLDYLSQLCGTVTDYRGVVKPLISSSEMQYLKKGENGAQVLVLRQGVRPYVVELPYFDKIYTVENYTQERVTKKLVSKKIYYSDWIDLAERYAESQDECDDESDSEERIKAFLKHNFDMYFGSADGNDN